MYLSRFVMKKQQKGKRNSGSQTSDEDENEEDDEYGQWQLRVAREDEKPVTAHLDVTVSVKDANNIYKRKMGYFHF
ncbi:hypothetical protein H6P81_011184 [Aristolochia fimbriata]|uniref:Uncharacterized protein n=1 Tax=Aristolochia fimbriata TaxID=158543 RepID=A0AAV7ERK8_ARIFI|nr:hypothetical protein H6P81_011184 [Aristolochia fimbriata]